MKYVYMGQIMAECDCQHYGCKMKGYCMAERIESLNAALTATLEREAETHRRNDAIMDATEAKLAECLEQNALLEARFSKAVEALQVLSCKCTSNCDWDRGDICPSWTIRTVLAELEKTELMETLEFYERKEHDPISIVSSS